MNRDVCEHFTPLELPCDKCRVCAMVTEPVQEPVYEPVRASWLPKLQPDAYLPNGELNPKYLQPATAKPPRTLTDEVIAELWHKNGGFHHHFARAIERWLKEQQ